jgi:hypothetical protein
MSDPGPFLKLWWKGVDIIGNLLTGVLLALLALGSWRLQQWWQRSIAKRHKQEDQTAARRQRLSQLVTQRDTFAAQAEQLTQGEAAKSLVARYEAWLDATRLRDFHENWERCDKWKNAEWGIVTQLNNGFGDYVVEFKAEIQRGFAEDVRGTVLPEIADDSYEWP